MASPFKWASGTNGFTTAPFDVLTTELNSVSTGNTALSSVGGSSGLFSNSNTGRDIYGLVTFVSGGTFTPSANSYIEGWFLDQGDDTTPEKFVTNSAQARAADFIIRLHAAAYASGDTALCNGRRVVLSPIRFKVGVRVLNATLPSSGNKIKVGGFEVEV